MAGYGDTAVYSCISREIKLPIIPDRRELYRYLGYRRETPDHAMLQRIDDVIEELNASVTPGFIYRVFPLSFMSEPNADPQTEPPLICFGGLEIKSSYLYRNLKGCTDIILMAATLGIAPDRMVRRASVKSISKAVIIQACAAAMVETLCNNENERFRLEAKENGKALRPRFSPGFGDLSLDLQRDFLNILDAQKNIGITLTESMLMTPTKSVTAVIGIYPDEDTTGDAS